jgi:phenylpropionate dioxygenase-like ring-hydroxylating dioxygenase large terminal subunit
LPSRTAQETLPWSWYSEPELLRREQERIFRRAWQYAGPAEPASERLIAHFQGLVREALA